MLMQRKSMTGKDARRGFERAGNEMDERYATEVFTEEALKIIASHKHQETPMFLMVSHLAPHTGNPGPNLLEVSNKTYNDMKFSYIENENRRLYAGKITYYKLFIFFFSSHTNNNNYIFVSRFIYTS